MQKKHNSSLQFDSKIFIYHNNMSKHDFSICRKSRTHNLNCRIDIASKKIILEFDANVKLTIKK